MPFAPNPDSDDALVLAHRPLVVAIAKRVHRRLPAHVDLDDLVSIGTVGLLDAKRRYSAERGVPFGAFVRRRISGAILDELRRRDLLSRRARAEVAAGQREFHELQLEHLQVFEHPVSPDPSPDANLQADEVRAAIRYLPLQTRRVIVWSFFLGLSLVEMGRRLGMPTSAVAMLRDTGLLELRRRLSGEAVERGSTPHAARVRQASNRRSILQERTPLTMAA